MTLTTIGVDVSKDSLDVHRLPDGESRRFANDMIGHKTLIAWLGDAAIGRIVYEATGPYHRAFERAVGAAGLPLVKVNPRRARRFAEAIGTLAKTDRVDAAMLAHMGQALSPKLTCLPSRTLDQLRELHVARQALIKDRTAAANRAKTLTQLLLKRHSAARLRQIETQMAAIDSELKRLVDGDRELKARFDILTSIPSIAGATAFALIIDMPELGTLENKQAASLAGLAPVTRQSGAWKGRAFIRGGRANLRQALYMPALVACRHNPDLKAKYQDLITAGKPQKVAITAIMRKLIVLANALLRDQRQWAEMTP